MKSKQNTKLICQMTRDNMLERQVAYDKWFMLNDKELLQLVNKEITLSNSKYTDSCAIDRSMATDILHDSYLRCRQKVIEGRFRKGKVNITGYFCGIVKNYIKEYRRAESWMITDNFNELIGELITKYNDVSDVEERREQQRIKRQIVIIIVHLVRKGVILLAKNPKIHDRRYKILRKRLFGKANRDIASDLNISTPQIRVEIFRTNRMIKSYIGKQGIEPLLQEATYLLN